ncbi:J domain-containing protein [Haematococcus lacustris]|uniref:J domain-containing protein n=1 Tax=Haematococcus lacustris TaxID=44745 RepID=A0A6A0AFY5_HAELA
MLTSRLEVPYFVKSSAEFERSHPYGSSARVRIERQARKFAMPSCEEVDRINTRLRVGGWY